MTNPSARDNILCCVKAKMSWSAQMKAKMVADEFEKVRKRERPSLKLTVAGVGV